MKITFINMWIYLSISNDNSDKFKDIKTKQNRNTRKL